MGRKAKPDHLRVVQGDRESKPKRRRGATPPPGKPRCPSFLPDEAKTEWRRIVGELEDMGIISRIDRAALVLYCEAWSTWREACDHIADNGATFRSPNGHLTQSPYVAIRSNAAKQMLRILREFGLTPASRSGVKIPDAADEDPFAAFLRGGG